MSECLRGVLQAALDKMEFLWQELDAQHGLCRNVMDVSDDKLWKEIVMLRSALQTQDQSEGGVDEA